MSVINNTYTVLINSKLRSSGTNENFYITLPQNLKDNVNNYQYVYLQNAIIPKSYYLIEDTRNTFILQESGSITTITIPIGGYSRRSFQGVIENLLNSNTKHSIVYTISYPTVSSQSDTGKYTISATNPLNKQISLIFNEWVYEQFGFDKSSTNTFTTTITSTNVIKMQREDSIIIHTDILSSENDNDILGVIFSQSDPNFSSIVYQPLEYEISSKKIKPNNFNSIRITLTNEDDQVINLNGQNIVMVLVFWSPTPLYRKALGYINYLLSKEK